MTMKHVLVCFILTLGLVSYSQTETNRTFLTTADYRRMLDALAKSPDVEIPKPLVTCVMGERPTYQFVCSVCGKETRYWREGFIDWCHIESLRKLVEVIRGLRCDARLDDTWLCQHCHPERFALERRPVSAVLKKGLQRIPGQSTCMRYVPRELEVSVKDVSRDGWRNLLVTKRPYTIVERSALDAENRLTRDVYASSFIPVIGEHPWKPKRQYEIRLAETQGIGGSIDSVKRGLNKGTKVTVEDMPPPVGECLVGTNDWSRYCLVTTPDWEIAGYWGCSVRMTDVTNVRYEYGVNGSFYPVFLSVNGGAKLRVGVRELSVLQAFLTGDPLAVYSMDRCCTTKSNIDWLRKLLLPEAGLGSVDADESAQSYIYEARQRLDQSVARCPEFRDAIINGCLQRMEWDVVSNLVVKAGGTTDSDRRMRLRTLRSIEAMRQADALIRRHCEGFFFNSGRFGGGYVMKALDSGLLLEVGSDREERLLPWILLFSQERAFARKIFDQCIQREWPDVKSEDVPTLPQIGFVLLIKYIVPDVPSSKEIYVNDFFRIRVRARKSQLLDEDLKLMFPEIPFPGNGK